MSIEDIENAEVDCLVMGGVADGVLCRIQFGAERIELGRPTHLKPLESSGQAQPEAGKEADVYSILMTYWPTETGQLYPLALAVIDGQSPAWAAGQLSVAYVKYSTDRLLDEEKRILQ